MSSSSSSLSPSRGTVLGVFVFVVWLCRDDATLLGEALPTSCCYRQRRNCCCQFSSAFVLVRGKVVSMTSLAKLQLVRSVYSTSKCLSNSSSSSISSLSSFRLRNRCSHHFRCHSRYNHSRIAAEQNSTRHRLGPSSMDRASGCCLPSFPLGSGPKINLFVCAHHLGRIPPNGSRKLMEGSRHVFENEYSTVRYVRKQRQFVSVCTSTCTYSHSKSSGFNRNFGTSEHLDPQIIRVL
mmetsp:Transcript_1105/g.2103  ORF Transcript_1105/g.2103 Transcript_1105/m.2103 type:complete len:237 (-) Transcript_1105:45-755(-)